MFSPTRTALYVAICAMGLAATEASAGCKIISGTKVCAAWITGSEICQVGLNINALPNIGTDPTAFTATCTVRGSRLVEGEYFCDDSALTGSQTCEGPIGESSTLLTTAGAGSNSGRQGPKCNHDKFDPNKNPQCVTGSPNLNGDTLESPPITLTCDKKGICTGIGEVGVPEEGATCSNGQTLVDFTADEFIGVVEFDGPEGGPILLFEHCTLDNGGHNYTCTDITNDVDEGSCGFFSD
jgi:hypothetical protein